MSGLLPTPPKLSGKIWLFYFQINVALFFLLLMYFNEVGPFLAQTQSISNVITKTPVSHHAD